MYAGSNMDMENRNATLIIIQGFFFFFIGQSQGTMLMFAKGSEDPEFGKKIKTFFALAPVTTIGHAEGFGRNLAKVLFPLC